MAEGKPLPSGKPDTHQEKSEPVADLARDGEATNPSKTPDEAAKTESETRGVVPEVAEKAAAIEPPEKAGPPEGAAPPVAAPTPAVVEPPDEPRPAEVFEPLRDISPEAAREDKLKISLKLVAIGAAALLVVGTGIAIAVRDTPPADGRDVPDQTSEELQASRLRADATEACARSDWKQCLAKLDEAKQRDPAGEASPEVQANRMKAVAGMMGGSGDTPEGETKPEKRGGGTGSRR